MKPKNKMLKAIFATAMISVASQGAFAANTGVEAYDTWEKDRVEQAVYPVLEKHTGLRDEVVAAYNDPKRDEAVQKVISKIEIGDNQPTHMLLFYAAMKDDNKTIRSVLDQTDNNRNLITGLMGNMMNFGKVGNDLTYLQRIQSDKTYDASSLLENAAYSGERRVASFVLKNFEYSAKSLTNAVNTAMDGYHHGFAMDLLRLGKGKNNADMTYALETSALRGEAQIAREIVKSYRYSEKDFSNTLVDAAANQQQKSVEAMVTAVRTGSKMEMTSAFEAVSAAGMYSTLPKMMKKFEIEDKAAFNAAVDALDNGQEQAAVGILRSVEPQQGMDVKNILNIAAQRDAEQVTRMIGSKFSVTMDMAERAYQTTIERDQTKIRHIILQTVAADTKKDMSDHMYELAARGDAQSAQLMIKKFDVSRDAGIEAMKAAHEAGHDNFVRDVGRVVKTKKPVVQAKAKPAAKASL